MKVNIEVSNRLLQQAKAYGAVKHHQAYQIARRVKRRWKSAKHLYFSAYKTSVA